MNKSYKKRWISEKIRKSLNFTSAVVITGARQVGKTTLIKNEEPFKNWKYYDLDDPDVRFIAEEKSKLLFQENFIAFDEVQKVPELLNYIKTEIDQNPKKKIILSGSSNLLLMKKITESLAGRAIFHFLLPFTYREWNEMQPLNIFNLENLNTLNCPEPHRHLPDKN